MRVEFDSNASAPTVAENDFLNEPGYVKDQVDLAELLSEGIRAAQSGKRSEARSFLLTVTESDPDNETAWLWLASISEYPEELLGFLNNVLRINSENERALEWRESTKALLSKTFVQRGIDASKDNRSDFAKQCFRQAIVHNEQSEMAWLWLAACADSDDEKTEYLEKVLDINPKNESASASLSAIRRQSAEPLLQEAFAAAGNGENERASELLDGVLSLDSELEKAWMLKFNLASSVGEKMVCLEKALELNPNNGLALSNLEFLHSMKSSDEIGEVVSEDAAQISVESDDDAVEDDVLPMNEVEFLHDVTEDEVDFLGEFHAEGFVVEDQNGDVSSEFENSAEEDDNFNNSIEEAEELSFDSDEDFESVEDKSEGENFDELQESPQAYFYEEPEDLTVDEKKYLIHDTETASEFSEDLNEGAQTEESPVDPQKEFEEFAVEASEILEHSELFSSEEPENNFDEEPQAVEAETFVSNGETESFERREVVAEYQSEKFDCPFCDVENDAQTFACRACSAVYSLSDLEMLLAPANVHKELIADAVRLTEAESGLRDLDADELQFLAVGYFNLDDPQKGISYLSEAARLDPDDILLASQVNALKIRMSEIDRKQNNYDSMPKNMTILVADDSDTVRKLISGKLEKCGHTVVCAFDGVDALEKLEAMTPDLILLDINMPRMDGYQACKAIRGNPATKDVPIVMISGKDGFFDKVRGRMAGTTGYITKPFGPETLMKTVETYIMQPA